MAVLLFANTASSTLAGPINAAAVAVSLAPGTGSLFPSPGANEFFCLTFVDASTGLLNEVVHCTARSADTLTIVRAQEGTSARSWAAGDTAGNYWTAGSAAAMLQQAQNQQQSSNYAVDSGTTNNIVLTLDPVPSALSALVGAPIRFKAANTTTSATVNVNVNGLGNQHAVNTGKTNLAIGNIVANGIYEIIWDGTNFQYNGQINPVSTALIQTPGTDNVRPVTAAALNGAFAGNNTGTVSASGYQKFPNGMIVQWGKVVLPTGINDTFNPPVSFDTAYTLATDVGYGSDPILVAGNTTFLAQFNFSAWYWNGAAFVAASGAGVGWVAVGY